MRVRLTAGITRLGFVVPDFVGVESVLPGSTNTAPTLAALPSQTWTVGTAVNVNLASYGADAQGAITFTAAGLPAGVSISATGLLTGTPTAVSSSSATITVTDTGGLTAQQPLSYTVQAAAPTNTAPAITTQPTISGGTTIGDILTLAPGAATGNPAPTATYQWSLDGVEQPGEIGATYVRPASVGAVPSCVVTWSNGVSPAATSMAAAAATAPPLVDRSAIYFDQTDAAEGTVTSLTARGSLALTFAEVALAGGASSVMEADGLELNGHILRNASALGSYSKMTILLDVTRAAAPISGAGELININSNGASATRFWLRYTASGFAVVGPNGVNIAMARIGGYGDRQVIGAELDLMAGTMTAIEADGETQQAAVATGPISITRVEIGKACQAKIHELAIILEA